MCDFRYEGRDRVSELGPSPLKPPTSLLERCAADDWEPQPRGAMLARDLKGSRRKSVTSRVKRRGHMGRRAVGKAFSDAIALDGARVEHSRALVLCRTSNAATGLPRPFSSSFPRSTIRPFGTGLSKPGNVVSSVLRKHNPPSHWA